MTDDATVIYNKLVDKFENDIFIYSLNKIEAKSYVYGYIDCLIDIGKLEWKDAYEILKEITQTDLLDE